jgi:dTDP-glucose 4,6-dehydratase
MKLLVTGGAGFIGSNYVYHVLASDSQLGVVVLDKLTYAGNLENLAGIGDQQKTRFSFVKGDVADARVVQEVFEIHRPRWVVHFAAESHVDRSILEPGVFLRTNVIGTQVLLDACRKFWKNGNGYLSGCLFLQVSTDEVYGALGPEGRFTENTPLSPRSPYSASKAAADMLALAYHNTYGLPVAVTRCSNNYGPYQFPDYGDGRQVRDWLYVEDHCRALELVRRHARPPCVYNIGGGCEMENIELVKLLLRTLGELTGDGDINESLIRHVADRPGHDRRYAIDPSKIARELGWRPQVEFAEGIGKTVDWYLNHQAWMEGIVSGEYLAYYEKNYIQRGN